MNEHCGELRRKLFWKPLLSSHNALTKGYHVSHAHACLIVVIVLLVLRLLLLLLLGSGAGRLSSGWLRSGLGGRLDG